MGLVTKPRIFIIGADQAELMRKAGYNSPCSCLLCLRRRVYFITAGVLSGTGKQIEVRTPVLYNHLMSCIRRWKACYAHHAESDVVLAEMDSVIAAYGA